MCAQIKREKTLAGKSALGGTRDNRRDKQVNDKGDKNLRMDPSKITNEPMVAGIINTGSGPLLDKV